MQLYFQDKRSDIDAWQGYLMSCENKIKPALHLLTTQDNCMKLVADEQALLWGQIEDDYAGVSTLRTLPKSEDCPLMPHIHASDLMQAKPLQGEVMQQYWAKFFVQALQQANKLPIYNGLWQLKYTNLPKWLGRKQDKWCTATADDQPFLNAHETFIDWSAANGNDNIINLFKPHADAANTGRIKWWLKVAQKQALPPLLLWKISALDAYVLIDGHDRLQAALINGIAPTFWC